MKTANLLSWFLMFGCCLAAAPAMAQRIHFATPVDDAAQLSNTNSNSVSSNSEDSSGKATTQGSSTVVTISDGKSTEAKSSSMPNTVPLTAQIPASPSQSYGAGQTTVPPPTTYSATPGATTAPSTVPGTIVTPSTPTVTTPAVTTPMTTSPGMASPGMVSPGSTFATPASPTAPVAGSSIPYAPPPAANFSGTIQPSPAWDPYATPCPSNGALLSQDPYLPAGAMGTESMQKFIQHIDVGNTWYSDAGSKGLGIHDLGLGVTFALPLFHNIQTPFLITPGFAFHFWQGPISELPVPADMPARTFDAYLDIGWNPQITPWFGAELDFSTGIYSDFDEVSTEAFRFRGKGLAVVRVSEHMQFKAGMWYLDRNHIKILPAGGIVWTPNPDVYFNILFPNPKVGKKFATYGTTEWWMFAAGEYGGGTWLIRRSSWLGVPSDGTHELVDYNDIEVSVGLEFKTVRKLDGTIEIGGAFSRELYYQNDSPRTYYPTNTVFLRIGMSH